MQSNEAEKIAIRNYNAKQNWVNKGSIIVLRIISRTFYIENFFYCIYQWSRTKCEKKKSKSDKTDEKNLEKSITEENSQMGEISARYNLPQASLCSFSLSNHSRVFLLFFYFSFFPKKRLKFCKKIIIIIINWHSVLQSHVRVMRMMTAGDLTVETGLNFIAGPSSDDIIWKRAFSHLQNKIWFF